MESVNDQQERIFRMALAPIPFAFNRGKLGSVFPPEKTSLVVPLSRPSKAGEVDAVFCPTKYLFSLNSLNLTGQFWLGFNKKFFITDLEIGKMTNEEETTPVTSKLLSEDFFARILEAATEAGRTRAMWFPPGSLIPGSGGSSARAGKNGWVEHLPESPSGGRGISRKTGVDGTEKHDRVWNDPIEIRRTVELMKAAEAAFKSPHYPKDQIDLSTKAKREQWVADASNIWSVGTVHVQLAIARKEGLIKSGRTKK